MAPLCSYSPSWVGGAAELLLEQIYCLGLVAQTGVPFAFDAVRQALSLESEQKQLQVPALATAILALALATAGCITSRRSPPDLYLQAVLYCRPAGP